VHGKSFDAKKISLLWIQEINWGKVFRNCKDWLRQEMDFIFFGKSMKILGEITRKWNIFSIGILGDFGLILVGNLEVFLSFLTVKI
jgi:hypothetical protein